MSPPYMDESNATNTVCSHADQVDTILQSILWYPTSPVCTKGCEDRDGYVWVMRVSDKPMLAPAAYDRLSEDAILIDGSHVNGTSEVATTATPGPASANDAGDADRLRRAIAIPTAPPPGTRLWIGRGVHTNAHPGIQALAYMNGHAVPGKCGLCAQAESRTKIIFARILEWKSSYCLGNYEWVQEFELVCERCPASYSKEARYTACYKKGTSGMDRHGSPVFQDVSVWSDERAAEPRSAQSKKRVPLERRGSGAGLNKCQHEGCKRHTIRNTSYCKMHQK